MSIRRDEKRDFLLFCPGTKEACLTFVCHGPCNLKTKSIKKNKESSGSTWIERNKIARSKMLENLIGEAERM